jgi:hypothetical protein
MESTRRTFIKSAAGVSAATLAGLSTLETAGASAAVSAADGPTASSPNWYERPMRWAQLSFVEDDPGNYSLDFWLDYFKKVHADAALVDAGGCVAFYPTEVPLHYRSKWLGSRDSFGDIVAASRKLGINVVARTDSHACHQDVYDAHPDWIAVDENGNKRRHWADKDYWVTCALGPYNFEFMTAVHREIVTRYMPDSIFTNRWGGSGMCYCENCQKNFREFSGLDLPRSRDPKDPARRKYMEWHPQRLFELCRLWDSTIKQVNPNASYLANAGGGAMSELNMKTFAQLAPMAIADRQSRRGLMAPWAAGMSAKEYRATMGMKPLAGLTCVGIDDNNRWKDSVTNGDEIRMWMVDGIAHNYRPTFTKFNAKPYDMRWFEPVSQVFNWHYANEKYLRNERSLARVGLVYSQQTGANYGFPDARAKIEDPIQGFYQALVEARIPFEMVHDELLDADHVSQFRTLILPNIACMSDAQCDQIKAFVRNGGGIVATLETSLYDEKGQRRSDFGLASLFGTSFAGKVDGPMLNSYLNLQKDAAAHPLLAGLGDTRRIINGTHQVQVTATGNTLPAPLLIEPTYPDLPMEAVFPRANAEHKPGVYLREEGTGRAVYFPADIDRTFWEVLAGDHALLLRNAVLWASNEPAPLEVAGKGVLDVALWSQKDSVTAHLVNLTNPMMLKGPVREIIPISKQTVRIRLPKNARRVSKARLLVAGKEVPFRQEDGGIVIDVPEIELHEVVALDLA